MCVDCLLIVGTAREMTITGMLTELKRRRFLSSSPGPRPPTTNTSTTGKPWVRYYRSILFSCCGVGRRRCCTDTGTRSGTTGTERRTTGACTPGWGASPRPDTDRPAQPRCPLSPRPPPHPQAGLRTRISRKNSRASPRLSWRCHVSTRLGATRARTPARTVS